MLISPTEVIFAKSTAKSLICMEISLFFTNITYFLELIASSTMVNQPKEIMMARMVKRTHNKPYKLVIGGEEKYLCQCGLSKNQPFCAGSHKLAKGENEDINLICWYDDAGKRYEFNGDFLDIRTF